MVRGVVVVFEGLVGVAAESWCAGCGVFFDVSVAVLTWVVVVFSVVVFA